MSLTTHQNRSALVKPKITFAKLRHDDQLQCLKKLEIKRRMRGWKPAHISHGQVTCKLSG